LLVGGVDPYDLPDPEAMLRALERTPFVVSLEQRPSAVTDRADVVFPVAAVAEKSGTFVDWEGRGRPFDTVLRSAGRRSELTELGAYRGERPDAPDVPQALAPVPERGEALLATWRLLLDRGRLQDGEPFLAGTAKAAVARLSPATAAEIGAGEAVTVSTDRGEVTLPLEVTADLPDRVVWLPTNSAGCSLYRDLGAVAGDVVRIAGGVLAGATAATAAASDENAGGSK